MKTRLLLLALLAAPLSSHAQTPEAETLARVERQASSWTDWRTRAADMEKDFLGHVTQSTPNTGPFTACLASLHQNQTRTVRRFDEWRALLLARWRSEATAGTLSTDEAARRTAYVERLYRLRMLMVYGNLAPRAIDDCAVGEDGKPNGRLLAAPHWAIAASADDLGDAQALLIYESGISEKDAMTY